MHDVEGSKLVSDFLVCCLDDTQKGKTRTTTIGPTASFFPLLYVQFAREWWVEWTVATALGQGRRGKRGNSIEAMKNDCAPALEKPTPPMSGLVERVTK